MPRIAILASDPESSLLIAATDRLSHVDCASVATDSPLDAFDAVTFWKTEEVSQQAMCDSARNGKHLLVDLATFQSVDDAKELVTACRDANVRLMIAQPLRFLPSIQAIRGSLDAEQLGAPGVLRIHRWADRAGDDINQLLIREIDLTNWLFGKLPNSIYAIARGSADSPDMLQVHLGFEGGGSALVDVTTALPVGDEYYSLSIIGADGSAYADDHHNSQLLFGGGPATAQTTNQGTLHWTAILREFAASIEESRNPSVNGETAIEALRVMAAIEQSIENGNALHRQGDNYEPV